MKKAAMILAAILLLSGAAWAEVTVKVRDISYIDGLKENQLFGYGLVVGLQGTGDTKKSPLALSSLKNVLRGLGMESDELLSQNSAAVLVTAQLPPFARVGDRIDVTVSSIGDAKSLEGGMLIQSPLRGADGAIYVAAQGPLSFGRQKGGTDRKFVRTSAVMPGGGIVEKEVIPEIVSEGAIYLVLKNWDYTMATEIMKSLAQKYPDSRPESSKGGKIRITIPKDAPLSEFIAGIESIEITPVFGARVVVSERDGTIVSGGEVKISECMVSREGLTVEVKEKSRKASAMHLADTGTVKELVDAMNAIGATTADIIAILKALKAAGALHAELIVR